MNQKDLPGLGLPLGGGHYGGIVRINGPLFAIVWAPKAEGETEQAWLPTRSLAPGADSCFDSLANTLAMADAGSALAKWALALRINGYDDWCVPARDVLEPAYRHFKPTTEATYCSFRDGDNPSTVPAGYPYTEARAVVQTPVLAFQSGGPEAFDPVWYWSSTQYSAASAWDQFFHGGIQSIYGKSFKARARAVRLIQLDA